MSRIENTFEAFATSVLYTNKNQPDFSSQISPNNNTAPVEIAGGLETLIKHAKPVKLKRARVPSALKRKVIKDIQIDIEADMRKKNTRIQTKSILPSRLNIQTVEQKRAELERTYGKSTDSPSINPAQINQNAESCEANLTEKPNTRTEKYIRSDDPESISFFPNTRRTFSYEVTAKAHGTHNGMQAISTKAKLIYEKQLPASTNKKGFVGTGITQAKTNGTYTTYDIDYAANTPREDKKFYPVTVTGSATCIWQGGYKLEGKKTIVNE
jgi:hypothetical protein